MQRVRKFLKIGVPLVLAAGILWWMYRGIRWEELVDALSQKMSWTWMLLSLPFGILAQVLRAVNRIIDGLYKENDQLRKEINFYENSRLKLLEKADQPRKNRIKMKEMENEIKKLEKDIISYKVESEEKEKKMEENEEINNEEIKTQEEEITAHENIVKELTTQINSLKKELKNKKNNKKKKRGRIK